MRVLVIKTTSLGDVIHTLPAITDAARAIPGIRFDWVVEEGFAEIPAWHPAVDRVIPVAVRRWRKSLWQTMRSGEWRTFKQRVSETEYDLVIDAQGLLKSAWLSRYARGPVAGLDSESARESMASRLYKQKINVPWGQHAVERTRQLFAQALGYRVPEGLGDYGLTPPAATADAAERADYVVFLHGTTWVTKHWPEVYWRELAERVVAQGLQVKLPWGSLPEQARAQRIAEGLESVQVLPRLPLASIAEVLAGAQACVAVDTGLGHLAAALDVPTLSLFGPTNPGFTGAYGHAQRHLASDFACAPCLRKTCNYKPTPADAQQFDLSKEQPLCFTRLAPERVLAQLHTLMSATRAD
ncbi:MAG: lipopolysaccharide heptosyltransferase I [Halopseudomonas sabulinigri]